MDRQRQDKGKEKEVRVSDSGLGAPSGVDDIVISKTGVRVKLRGPIEDPWNNGDKWKAHGFSCGYCVAKKENGGATRFREHLAGLQGSVVSCPNVPRYVRDIMLHKHAKGRENRLDAKEHKLYVEKAIMDEAYGDDRRARIPHDEMGQMEWALRESLRDYRGSGSSSPCRTNSSTPPLHRASSLGSQTKIDRYYRSPSVSESPFDIDLAHSKTPVQPRVDIMLQGDAKGRLGKALAKWFHYADIPRRKADSPYFIAAIKLAQQLGEEVAILTGKDIDGPLLDMNYNDLQAQMEEHKENWSKFGVTIMCDSWTGPTMMCIINFMIFCNGRMFFHKTMNATGHVQNKEFIYDCLKKVVVEEIGQKLVVQIVTDNGSNYKKACKQLIAEYPHITWQPCAAHTINLMLKDIARFVEVEEVVDSAKRICRFLYNHNRMELFPGSSPR